MISCSRKILSAAAAAAVLLTTVAIASSVQLHAPDPHSQATSATTGQAAYERSFGSEAGRTSPFTLDGNFACPFGYVDCATLETQLPQ
jgi:hypothetical protein